MRVVAPASLLDDALVLDAGFMGAPTVGIEKLDTHQAEAAALGERVQRLLGNCGRRAIASGSGPLKVRCSRSSGAGCCAASAAAALAAYRSTQGYQSMAAALLAGEIGGGNSIEPLSVGARMRLPVADADLMGRAFPELQVRAVQPEAGRQRYCIPALPPFFLLLLLFSSLPDDDVSDLRPAADSRGHR
jgi:hypothetical protein